MFYSYLFKDKVGSEPRMIFSDPAEKVSRKLPEVKRAGKKGLRKF
jgi:hypothetical protein